MNKHRAIQRVLFLTLCLAPLGLASPSFGATIVVPNSLATVEGNPNNGFPFNIGGFSTASQRFHQVFNASEFGDLSGPELITKIAFRPEGGQGTGFSSTLTNVQINLSTTSAAADSLSSTFATNVGSDDTVVFSGSLTFTVASPGTPTPRPFEMVINLQTPFLYDPNLGNLLLDVRNIDGGTTTQFDAQETASDPISRVYSPVTGGVNDASGTADTLGLVTQFTTIPADSDGPVTRSTTAIPNPVAIGSNVDLTATVDDTGLGDSDIASAEYSLDGGAFTAMTTDNGFNAVSEDVEVSFSAPTVAGIYDLCVRGTDSPGNVGDPECIMLVVYDPDGGFVTGGGWIDSPAGACQFMGTCESAIGKANFGFVSKYKKGATVPTGNTEFQFRAGDLNFHSESYEWLVIAGYRAQYKGVGTINGGGNYGFMLFAIDANLTPSTDVDLFRIKIWDKDNGDVEVYDNEPGEDDDAPLTTQIGGGSIMIHTKGKK